MPLALGGRLTCWGLVDLLDACDFVGFSFQWLWSLGLQVSSSGLVGLKWMLVKSWAFVFNGSGPWGRADLLGASCFVRCL